MSKHDCDTISTIRNKVHVGNSSSASRSTYYISNIWGAPVTPGYYWKLLRFTDCVDWLINLIIRYIRLTWLFNLHREINFARKSAIVCTAWFPSLTLFLISSSLVLCIALLECLMKRYKCFIFSANLFKALSHYKLYLFNTMYDSLLLPLLYIHFSRIATACVIPTRTWMPPQCHLHSPSHHWLTGRITVQRATLSDRPLTTWSYSIINCLGYPYRKDFANA